MAGVGLDEATICAALLHDVVEDTDMTDEELRKFCLEQAVKVIASNPNARDLKGLCKVDAISVFDLSNAFIAYIKNGDQTDVHINLHYLVE